MKILVFSVKENQLSNLAWHHSCSDISYFRNGFHRYSSEKYYYTLTFSYTFEYDDDEVYYAYNYPYTYTEL